MNIRKTLIALSSGLALAAFAVVPPAFAGDSMKHDDQATTAQESEFKGKMRDAWIDGKVETALLLNSELNSFAINTNVRDGEVILSGIVDSEIKSDLAEEITKSIEGVSGVTNNIAVSEEKTAAEAERTESKLRQAVSNATAAAVLKTRLLANDEVSGLDINVDVKNGVATLRGSVESEAEKQLAGYIATNVDGIDSVTNELTIAKSS